MKKLFLHWILPVGCSLMIGLSGCGEKPSQVDQSGTTEGSSGEGPALDAQQDVPSPEAAEALPMLQSVLEDEDSSVGEAAVRSLSQFGAEGMPSLKKALEGDSPKVQSAAARALGQLGPAAIPTLVESLQSGNLYAKFSAASALGSMGAEGAQAIPALEKAMEDEDPRVRSAVQEALKKIQDNR